MKEIRQFIWDLSPWCGSYLQHHRCLQLPFTAPYYLGQGLNYHFFRNCDDKTQCLFESQSNPTPRIGLFVRPSVGWSDTKKSRIRYTCFRVKDHGYKHHSYLHHTCMHQDRGSYIYASGSRVIYIYASYMHASGIEGHIYMHHGYMHICIGVKDQDHIYIHHNQGQGSQIYASYV